MRPPFDGAESEEPMPTPFDQTTRALQAGGRRWLALGALIGVAVLTAWIAWFATARVAVFVPGAPARVELDRPGQPIQVEVGGRLVESHIALDRAVSAGDLLLKLDDRETRLARAEEQARLAGLRARRATRHAEFEARAGAHDPAAAVDSAAVAEARARLEAARAAHAQARGEARRARELADRAVAPTADADRLQAAARQARATVRELEQQVARLDAQRDRGAAERDASQAALSTELAALDAEIAGSTARLERLDAQLAAHAVRAPTSGRIAEIDPQGIGAVLQPGARLGTIVGDGGLRIVARLPVARALGRVKPGQRARLRVDGFPWTRYGVVAARVTGVAAEARDGALRIELAPLSADEDGYEPHDVPLQHGLTGQIEIEVEQITPLQMLLAALGRLAHPGESGAESAP